MPSHLRPGVYIKEIPERARPIEAMETSTAIFIGQVEKGPIGSPLMITSWIQYESEFGDLRETQSAVSGSLFSVGDAMGLAVYAFFQNGGVKAYVARVTGSDNNGQAPCMDDYDTVFEALRKVPDINIILLPGQVWDVDGQPIIESAIAHCEVMKNRMIVFDLPAGHELNSESDIQVLNLTTSSYAAVYYPWPVVNNRFYKSSAPPGTAKFLLVSPAAFAAGIWAKIDGLRGVWKAPAGVESGLLGINQLEYVVGSSEQDYLNPQGVNTLRRLSSIGPVLWGARTLSTRTNREWRYVSVRRTAMFIEESLYNGTRWVVFEANNEQLWSALRANVESFMEGLFRAGAFQGSKASSAYFVQCGLGQTMTQDDVIRGRVIVQIGFAASKPAEFVIVRIQQNVQR